MTYTRGVASLSILYESGQVFWWKNLRMASNGRRKLDGRYIIIINVSSATSQQRHEPAATTTPRLGNVIIKSRNWSVNKNPSRSIKRKIISFPTFRARSVGAQTTKIDTIFLGLRPPSESDATMTNATAAESCERWALRQQWPSDSPRNARINYAIPPF